MSGYDKIEEVNKGIDHIEEVQKFNPYHGKDGRFTSGSGGAVGGGTAGAAGSGDDKKQVSPADEAIISKDKGLKCSYTMSVGEYEEFRDNNLDKKEFINSCDPKKTYTLATQACEGTDCTGYNMYRGMKLERKTVLSDYIFTNGKYEIKLSSHQGDLYEE